MADRNNYPWKKSLRARISVMIAISSLIAFVLLAVMITITDSFVFGYFDDIETWNVRTEAKADELQEFITENGLALKDASRIQDWQKHNTNLYLYISSGDEILYDKSADFASISAGITRNLKFADGEAELNMFYGFKFRAYNITILLEIIVALFLFFVLLSSLLRRIVNEIRSLESDVRILEGGGLDYSVPVVSSDELGSLEKSIEDMRIALKDNLEREEEVTRANYELVTRMAHDLRTPLTSLLIYLDLIKSKRYKNDEQLDQYVDVARDKAESIKEMSDLLFERFLVTGDGYSEKDQSDKKDQPELVRYALEDPLSSFIMSLEAHGIKTVSDFRWPNEKITVSMNYINRILENIDSNILKYADRSEPVVIDMTTEERMPINGAERRVVKLIIHNRKDANTNSSSDTNKIGLENIRIMMERMNGALVLKDEEGTFETDLLFPAL